jgi:hypothetical protein
MSAKNYFIRNFSNIECAQPDLNSSKYSNRHPEAWLCLIDIDNLYLVIFVLNGSQKYNISSSWGPTVGFKNWGDVW